MVVNFITSYCTVSIKVLLTLCVLNFSEGKSPLERIFKKHGMSKSIKSIFLCVMPVHMRSPCPVSENYEHYYIMSVLNAICIRETVGAQCSAVPRMVKPSCWVLAVWAQVVHASRYQSRCCHWWKVCCGFEDGYDKRSFLDNLLLFIQMILLCWIRCK